VEPPREQGAHKSAQRERLTDPPCEPAAAEGAPQGSEGDAAVHENGIGGISHLEWDAPTWTAEGGRI